MEVKLLVEGVQCDDAWERTEDKQATCKESSERQTFYRKWKSLLIQVRKFKDNKKVNHIVLVIDFFPLSLCTKLIELPELFFPFMYTLIPMRQNLRLQEGYHGVVTKEADIPLDFQKIHTILQTVNEGS